MPIEARLIFDAPQAGELNMGVDQALLDQCRETPVLRFYRWSRPTVSLGYFQPHQDRQQHVSSQACPWLRRSTGGGAIIHDRELTYSLIVPASLVPRRSADLYDLVHNAFCNWLRSVGLQTYLFDDSLLQPSAYVNPKTFLCFQRRADGDVVAWDGDPEIQKPPFEVAGNKLLGSAQRKQKNALLQHGSLLIKRSDAAPELPGLMDLPNYNGPTKYREAELAIQETLTDQVSQSLDWNWTESCVTEIERDRAAYWVEQRFQNLGWNNSR